MTSTTVRNHHRGFTLAEYVHLPERHRVGEHCASCISASASSRPGQAAVWLFIFAAGFRQVLGISIIPPYETYILYEVYITPGLMAMIQLFNGMQSSLSMSTTARWATCATLLVSPLREGIFCSASCSREPRVSLLQVYAFLLIAWFWDIAPPPIGYLTCCRR